MLQEFLPQLQPLAQGITRIPLDKLDPSRPTKIPWTEYYQCQKKSCNKLPLDDERRCVRYIPVEYCKDVKNFEDAVLTCADPEDRLPPKACILYYFLT